MTGTDARTTGAGAPPAGSGVVLGVLGASGGVGASALVTALAVRAAAANQEVALVDGHPWGGGLDVFAGLDHQPGLRWADLRGVRGDVDPYRLVAELPGHDSGLRCLSWGTHPPGEATPGPDPVLSAVRRAVDLVVVDLPRPAAGADQHLIWWAACHEVILLVHDSVVGLGAAGVLAPHVPEISGLVVRGSSGLTDRELGSALGAPVLVRLADDRSVASSLERGSAVGSELGPLTDAADELLARLLPAVRVA